MCRYLDKSRNLDIVDCSATAQLPGIGGSGMSVAARVFCSEKRLFLLTWCQCWGRFDLFSTFKFNRTQPPSKLCMKRQPNIQLQTRKRLKHKLFRHYYLHSFKKFSNVTSQLFLHLMANFHKNIFFQEVFFTTPL